MVGLTPSTWSVENTRGTQARGLWTGVHQTPVSVPEGSLKSSENWASTDSPRLSGQDSDNIVAPEVSGSSASDTAPTPSRQRVIREGPLPTVCSVPAVAPVDEFDVLVLIADLAELRCFIGLAASYASYNAATPPPLATIPGSDL